MRKVSKKRQEQNKAYKVVRDKFMTDNPYCERCGREATENHHTNGRSGDRLLDTNYFMAVCRSCHVWIHEHPKESREVKWLI
jgi:ribosomal protein S27AE